MLQLGKFLGDTLYKDFLFERNTFSKLLLCACFLMRSCAILFADIRLHAEDILLKNFLMFKAVGKILF